MLDVGVSALGSSVLVGELNSAVAEEIMPEDQEALGMILLATKVLRLV